MQFRFLAVVLVAVLQACGGGGSDSQHDDAPPATYDLNALQTSLVTSSRSYTASARSGADNYELFLSVVPAADAVFEGSTRKHATQSLTIRKNGATLVATTFDGYYSVGPFQLIGAVYAGGGYLVSTAQPPLPTAALIGASGSSGTQTLYENATKTTVFGIQSSTWTLDAGSSGSARYCVNTMLTSPAGAPMGTTVGCYLLGAGGAVQGIRWTIAVEGLTLTFQ